MRLAPALAIFLLAVAALPPPTEGGDVKPDPRVRRLRLRPRDRLNKLRARGSSSVAAAAESDKDDGGGDAEVDGNSRSTRQLPAALRTRKRVRRPTVVPPAAPAAEVPFR